MPHLSMMDERVYGWEKRHQRMLSHPWEVSPAVLKPPMDAELATKGAGRVRLTVDDGTPAGRLKTYLGRWREVEDVGSRIEHFTKLVAGFLSGQVAYPHDAGYHYGRLDAVSCGETAFATAHRLAVALGIELTEEETAVVVAHNEQRRTELYKDGDRVPHDYDVAFLLAAWKRGTIKSVAEHRARLQGGWRSGSWRSGSDYASGGWQRLSTEAMTATIRKAFGLVVDEGVSPCARHYLLGFDEQLTRAAIADAGILDEGEQMRFLLALALDFNDHHAPPRHWGWGGFIFAQ